jgi:hypothetical protein
VKQLAQAKPAINQPVHGKAWWVCIVASLSFCLWMINFLPVQRVEYVLRSNLAISQHRLPLLNRLKSKEIRLAGTDVMPFTITEIKPTDSESNSNTNSELVAVRVTLRMPERRQAESMESILESLTMPSSESIECNALASQLRKERWMLESNQHSLKLIELDSDRERNAVPSDAVSESMTDESTPREKSVAASSAAPFRLASFSFRNPREPNSDLKNQLQKLAQAGTERIDSMTVHLERLRTKARGFLSFTGAPQIEPMAHSMSSGRYIVLMMLGLGVWLLSFFWIKPLPEILRSPGNQSTLEVAPIPKVLRWPLVSSIDKKSVAQDGAPEFSRTLEWMQSVGIQFLGKVQVETESVGFVAETQDSTISVSPATKLRFMPRFARLRLPNFLKRIHLSGHANAGQANVSIRSSEAQASTSLHFLRVVGDRALVVWGGLFFARLVLDSSWRELASIAPLAAISRLIFGIQ